MKKLMTVWVSSTSMRKKRASEAFDFLGLPKTSRNRVTGLFGEIKAELRKGYSLKELGLQVSSWHNVGLDDFISLPKKRYIEIIDGKPHPRVSRKELKGEINKLFKLLEKTR